MIIIGPKNKWLKYDDVAAEKSNYCKENEFVKLL